MSYGDVSACTDYRREYTPAPPHRAIYEAHFREFVNLYRQNKQIYRRLNGKRERGNG